MSDVSVKFRNKDKFFQRLVGTVPAINDNLRGAMMIGADEMVDKAKQFVPKDEGEVSDSIEWDWTENTQKDKTRSPALVIYAGGTDLDQKGFYASFLEHGTVNMIRRPFFFPAYRIMKRKVRGLMTRAMSAAIKQAGFG